MVCHLELPGVGRKVAYQSQEIKNSMQLNSTKYCGCLAMDPKYFGSVQVMAGCKCLEVNETVPKTRFPTQKRLSQLLWIPSMNKAMPLLSQ